MRIPLRNIIVGFLTGITDSVPGVSGATILLLCGVYGDAVKKATTILYDDMPMFVTSVSNREVKLPSLKNYVFVGTLLAGILFGALSMAVLIDLLLDAVPSLVFGAFSGVILSSGLIILHRDVESYNGETALLVMLGMVISTSISLVSIPTSESLVFLFFAGALATFGMVLPGVSGSFVLLVLGKYEFIISTVSDFLSELPSISSSTFIPLSVFGIGATIGLAMNLRVISSLLESKRSKVIRAMVGLVFGGVAAPVREIRMLEQIWLFGTTTAVVVSFVIVILSYAVAR